MCILFYVYPKSSVIFWDMWPNIVKLENNFVMSLLVLWTFILQCSTKTHQFRSIPITCNGFTPFQQLIIQHTELVLPNVEHNLGAVKIRSGRRFRGISGHSP